MPRSTNPFRCFEKIHDPFRWFDQSPEVIRLVVMMYVRYPLSLRNAVVSRVVVELANSGQAGERGDHDAKC